MNEEVTIVSVVPFPFHEAKPGVFPNLWKIPPVPAGDVEVLPVGRVTTWEYIDEHRGSREIIIPARQFADSLVRDYLVSILLYKPDAHPGLQVVDGVYTKEEAKKKLDGVIKSLREIQQRWFVNIVQAADDIWQETHQYQHITDMQRSACVALGLKREWNFSVLDSEVKECPACVSLIPARATVCRYCQTKLAA